MASQVTVTAPTGPGLSVSGKVFTGLRNFNLDLAGKTLSFDSDQGPKCFDINATTTLTCTITAGANATLVVSQ